MAAPSGQLATLRPELGTFTEFDLVANREKFIGTMIMPFKNVPLAADSFGKIPVEQLLKRADTKRGSTGGYNRLKFTFDDDSYATKEHGLEGPIDQRNARMYANYFDAEVATTKLVAHSVLLEQEMRYKDLLYDATTYSAQTTAVTNEWSDFANAAPIQDVDAAVRRFHVRTGIWPDTLVMAETVFKNLRLCGDVLDRIQSGGAGSASKQVDVTIEMLKALFDLRKIYVGAGSYNSANEGQAGTIVDIWDDEYVLVTKTADSDEIEEPCIGRTMHWAGDGSMPGGLVETYWEENVRGDVVRVRHDVQEKLLYPEMVELLSNITE